MVKISGESCDGCVIPNEVDSLMPVDAVEVKHGFWTVVEDGLMWLYKCSVCGRRYEYAKNYCPNCGAKMDLDGGEENAEKP